MAKKTKVMYMLAVCLFFYPLVFAETIVLKNGKIVQGAIVENTGKSIKVDFDGVPLTYYYDEIASIDGKNLVVPPLKKEDVSVSSPGPDISSQSPQVSKEWANWYASVSGYLTTMQVISVRGNNFFMQLRQEFETAYEKKDTVQVDQIINKIKAQMTNIINEFKALQPPEEFQRYHAKQMDVFQQMNMAIDRFTDKDASGLLPIMRNITVSMIEVCQEIKRVYMQHNPPKDFITAVDMVIEQLNMGLEKLDTVTKQSFNKTKIPK